MGLTLNLQGMTKSERVATSLVTLFLITFILFVLVRVMPGNPFPSERMSAEQIANKRAEMGLDDPVLVQFFRYIGGVLHGDFGKGTSSSRRRPAARTSLSRTASPW